MTPFRRARRSFGKKKQMAKKVAGTMKLQVPAGQANPSPPVGPALGQRGINIMEFCKAFNAKTQELDPVAPCPTVITYYVDKSFTMDIKTPPASYMLKKAAKLSLAQTCQAVRSWDPLHPSRLRKLLTQK